MAQRGTGLSATVLLAVAVLGAAPRVARADAPLPSEGTSAPEGQSPGAHFAIDLEKALPPPTDMAYLQYGVAFTAEAVAAPGPICDNVSVPCILGQGGGIAVRAGYRGAGHFYVGGAYELSKQDPTKLYRLALLQQLRVEGRYYFNTSRQVDPYVHAAFGASGYGNEWSVDTFGPMGSLGMGVEWQITRRTVIGLAAGYRLLYFRSFVDSSLTARDGGVAQLFGFDLVLEQRDPIGGTSDRGSL